MILVLVVLNLVLAVALVGAVAWCLAHLRKYERSQKREHRDCCSNERESELLQTLEVLRRTNQDLEQFAYSASHDLQEPLRMIGSWSEALFEDYGERLREPEAQEMRQFIAAGVVRMRTLINDLLRFSRAGRNLHLRVHSLTEAVNDAISSLALAIKEKNGVVEGGGFPRMRMDLTMMTQVFQNLISNSLKFSHPDRAPRIIISYGQAKGFHWIHVSDNGIGIPAKYQDQVFEVFTRLHSQDEISGTGIGLALVRRIVHAHGGQVSLASRENVGTTVSFSLPVGLRDGSQEKPDATTTVG